MISRYELLIKLNELLKPEQIKDYCPNGLQIEGNTNITRIATAVSATGSVIEQAIAQQAQALLVHHGFFWKGEPLTITGVKRQRIASLLKHNINLYAYHLPLDVHPTLGNNAQLAQKLGWQLAGTFGDNNLIAYVDFEQPITLNQLQMHLFKVLERDPFLIGSVVDSIRRVAFCTGAAQDFLEIAAEQGAQVYISGEISERTVALARELGIVYVCAGHYATEQFGVQAVGRWLRENHQLDVFFIDDDNPV